MEGALRRILAKEVLSDKVEMEGAFWKIVVEEV